MILYENDFLKTYNEMNRLWEDVEKENIETEDASASTVSRKDPYLGVSCDDIVKYAELDAKTVKEKGYLPLTAVKYWKQFQRLIKSKNQRPGDIESKNWVDRFMWFYKAYLVEVALLKWFHQQNGTFTSSVFGDGEAHHSLFPGVAKDAQPDIKIPTITIDGKDCAVECKGKNSQSSIHDAHLVARHVPFANGENGQLSINFWLVYKNKSFAENQSFAELMPKMYKRQSLKAAFVQKSNEAPTGKLDLNVPPVYNNLTIIEDYLSTDPIATKITIAQAINKQTKELADTLQDLVPIQSDISADSLNPVKAADQLADLATDIASTFRPIKK
jgi:hypothetical protein